MTKIVKEINRSCLEANKLCAYVLLRKSENMIDDELHSTMFYNTVAEARIAAKQINSTSTKYKVKAAKAYFAPT